MFTGEFLSAVSCEGCSILVSDMCLAGLVVSMVFGLALCAMLCLCVGGGSQSIPISSCFNVHFLLKFGFVHCYSFLKVFLLGLLTDNNLRLAEQK